MKQKYIGGNKNIFFHKSFIFPFQDMSKNFNAKVFLKIQIVKIA